jgi:hypothetical protein
LDRLDARVGTELFLLILSPGPALHLVKSYG